MNLESLKREAYARMPKIKTHIADGLYRHEVVNLLSGHKNIGIELGVASGLLAKRFLDSDKLSTLYGIDVYGDIHDTAEYKLALKTIGLDQRHKLLRLTFEDALELFPDEYFDFIYVDGFAHTGEDGGKTLVDWYRKLKVGGLMSGDDYHADWPLVMWAVNHFSSQIGSEITLTGQVQDDKYSKYPTWFFKKQRTFNLNDAPLDLRLIEIAAKERARIHKLRTSPIHQLERRVVRFVKRAVFSR
jgi:hypothetical protein